MRHDRKGLVRVVKANYTYSLYIPDDFVMSRRYSEFKKKYYSIILNFADLLV